eukprot:gene16245-16423_t
MRPRTNAAPAIALAILTAAALAAHAQTLTKIADFTSVTGGGGTSLIVDSNGNLFGTTSAGGANTSGTVFEIAKTGSTYGTVTTITTFNGTNGSTPLAGISFDASGNLFGTTPSGGCCKNGTVFEVTNSGFATSGGSSTPNPSPTPDPTAVPEPATAALLGAGLIALLAASRRSGQPA